MVEHEVQQQFLQAILIAGSGGAAGMLLTLAVRSVIDAVKKKDYERAGHIALAFARLGGAVVIGLVGEALWRSPQPPPPSGRAWAYAAALVAIAVGYVIALWRRVVPR